MDDAAKGARGRVDVLQGRPSRSISETIPSPARMQSDLATALISPTASLSRLLARAEPRQP